MQESPIFTKTYELLLWLVPTTIKFPREHRFVLSQTIQKTAFQFQEEIIEASLRRGKTQERVLVDADVTLTQLRFYLRLCQDMKLLSPGQYRHASLMVSEVGRLLGGWRKSIHSM